MHKSRVQDYGEFDGIVIVKTTVLSTSYWNNDGLDITDSKNVSITNCNINSVDDVLCFKSGSPKT